MYRLIFRRIAMEKIYAKESIISHHYQTVSGKDVWRDNLRTCIFVADKIRSALGPTGAYKLVTYNRGPEQVIKVTRDAVAVLDELAIQYPPAVIVAESAKLQRQEAGDGVATFVLVLSALLRKADELMTMGLHANTIVHAYHLATQKALEIIDAQATSFSGDVLDTVDCGRNILTPKMRSIIRQAYPYAFEGDRFEVENVRFLRRNGGRINDSSLTNGVVVKKDKAHPNMPDRLRNLRITLVSERLGFDRLETKMRGDGPIPLQLNITSADHLRGYRQTEVKLKTQGFDKLHEFGVNVLLCEQPIEEIQKTLLLSEGIYALERVDKKDSQAVAKATGAHVVGSLKELTNEDIGLAEELYTDKIELEKTTTIQGCKAATILLRGNIPQEIDELETAIKNSLTVLKLAATDSKLLPGGGAIEAQIAEEIKNYAKTFEGREQIAVEAYANAFLDVPKALAENYGLNVTDTMLELRRRHAEGDLSCGVCAHSCVDWVCAEPLKKVRAIIRRAYEVSSLMLRIDSLLISKEIPKFHKK
jgi:chaperonin GroEL (HSP60 family)